MQLFKKPRGGCCRASPFLHLAGVGDRFGQSAAQVIAILNDRLVAAEPLCAVRVVEERLTIVVGACESNNASSHHALSFYDHRDN